jgi:hypothetical protein
MQRLADELQRVPTQRYLPPVRFIVSGIGLRVKQISALCHTGRLTQDVWLLNCKSVQIIFSG